MNDCPKTILTAYLDESGTHDESPVMVMAGYLGTAAQWADFEADWNRLLKHSGVTHVHAVDLFKRTNEFRGWNAEAVNSLALQLEQIISTHLELGFTTIVRSNDYESIYRTRERPPRTVLDSKYGVCFRAVLAVVPSFIASQLLALGKGGDKAHTINFVLEYGHRNVGDAQRLFDLYKSDALPEWSDLVGSFDLVTKTHAGTQAADFLAYSAYRIERAEHGKEPTVIERSSYVYPASATIAEVQEAPPRPMVFRIPISRDVLRGLRDDFS